jgi:transcriptional regulator with XRE-family HTH domain
MRLEQDLIALREAQGVSQVQLAKALGVSQPAIAKLESGKAKNIELKTLVRAVSALGGTVKIQITPGAKGKHQGVKKRALPTERRLNLATECDGRLWPLWLAV